MRNRPVSNRRPGLPSGAVLTSILALTFLALPRVDAADRLTLPNGEVLLGSLVAETDDAYLFHSDSFGDLKVLKAVQPLLERDANATAAPQEHQPGWAAATPAPVPPPPVAKSEPPPPPKKEKGCWERSVEAGYSFQARGEDLQRQSTYLRAEITRKSGDNSLQLYGKYLFGEQNDENNANMLEAGFRIRQGLVEVVQFRNDFSYSYDRLKELSNQFENIAGITVRLIDSSAFKLRVGPGFAVQYAEPKLGENGFKYLGDVSEEFQWILTQDVTFSQSASYLYDPKNWNDYRLRLFSTLSCKLVGNASINLRYEYEYEALRPVAEGRSDHRVYTTLGYKF